MSIVSPRDFPAEMEVFFSHFSQVPGGQIRSGPKFDLLYAPQAGNDQEHHVQATALGLPQKSNTKRVCCATGHGCFLKMGPRGTYLRTGLWHREQICFKTSIFACVIHSSRQKEDELSQYMECTWNLMK